MKKSRMLAIIMAVVLAVGLTACGTAKEESAEKSKSAGAFPGTQDNEYCFRAGGLKLHASK